MIILNKKSKKEVEVNNERQIKRMLRYPDLFEEVKAKKEKEVKVEEPKAE